MVNFPELWLEQQSLGVDCVLISTFSGDPVFEVLARGHAAANGLWVSMAVAAQCTPAGPSTVIGPHGHVLGCARVDGPMVLCVDLNPTDPAFDIALTKARPWRALARTGDIYARARVEDPRSTNRTSL